jgi:predicted transcriptional regulator
MNISRESFINDIRLHPVMTFRSLNEIKRLRKKFHLNQKELADRAGVSQSLIAKVEAGTVEPTFSKAQKIFEALEELREKEEVKAKELMHKKVFFVDISDSLKNVITLMKQKDISQVPVLSKGRVCGIITEGMILQAVMKHSVSSLHAGDVMEDAPPIVSLKTGLRTLTELLRDYPVVLVSEKGDVKGIISKADLLGRIE